MAEIIKYYKFMDPITGKLTKNLGFYREREVLAKLEGEKIISAAQTIKISRLPCKAELTEITKEEFDALDTSGESETAKYLRSCSLRKAEMLLNAEVTDKFKAVFEVIAESKVS